MDGREDGPEAPATERARSAVRAFLRAPGNAALLRHLQADLGISAAEIEEGCMRYTLESFDSDNSMYAAATTHIAMWIEYQSAGGMHDRRQAAVLNALQRWQPRSIVDVGFGAPTRYLAEYVLRDPEVTADLLDKFPSAIEVGRSILSFTNPEPAQRVRFALHDMDRDPPLQGRACYLMLDSIEHAARPGDYLGAAVAGALPGALFLFHLPIGPLIASHSIAWESDAAAVRWLEASGLQVDGTETIAPNPEVDHFARDDVAITDLFVVARKR